MLPYPMPAWLIACLDLRRDAAVSPRCPMQWLGRLLVLLSAMVCLPVQAAQSVTLLLSEPVGIYLEAAQALQKELTRDGRLQNIRLQHVDDRPNFAGAADDLIVTLGVRALKYALDAQGTTPLFALLVPSLTFEKLISDRSPASRQRLVSALFLDQPYTRQLQLIRLALPNAKRVGVLVGSATMSQTDELKKAGRETGLDIRIHTINNREQLFPGLHDLAREVDVLLLLPDPQVVSGETLRALFLKTYRFHLPIVAYAASLVQAGATLGLYATPAQLGSEAGKWIREISGEKGANKATLLFPQLFTVEINRNVVRTLELPFPAVESINSRLEAERGR